jgi:DHA2 family multidrug resistance protein
MLDKGKDADWFSSGFIVVLACVALVGFIVFLIWEFGEKHPIVDLSLFRNRNFAIGTVALCLGYAIFFGAVVLQPLWMQTWLGYNATWAGFVAAPSGVVAVLLSPMVGRNIGKFDARLFATASFAAFAVSYFMRAGYTADASFGVYMVPLMVQGIGMSMFFVSMLAIGLDGVPDAQVPAAAGLSNFLRITAGSFSTSITTTFWDRHAALHQTRLAEASSVYDPTLHHAMQTLQAGGLTETQSLGALARVLGGQAYLMSALDFFWICGWLSLAAVLLVWFTRRPHGGPHAVAAD